jgi:hypothetical protein
VVEEAPLKLASLLPLRGLRVVFLAWMLAGITSGADALMYCDRASEYPPISDPILTRRIEERLQAIPAMKNHQIRKIDGQFAIAWQDEEECRKLLRCYHLLLDIRNDEARVIFAFRGTGTIWVLGSALNTLSDLLDDDYSINAFETDDFNYVEVRLPRFLGPVWVGALPSDNKTMKACARRKYE